MRQVPGPLGSVGNVSSLFMALRVLIREMGFAPLLSLLYRSTTDWEAETTEVYFLMILKARSPKSKCLQVCFLLRPLSLAYRWSSSPPCVSTGLSSVCICV